MMFESVFACARANQTMPSVSSAAIIDSRGLTELSSTFVLPSLGAHVLRVWLVSLSQVSSMLMILLPSWWSSINFSANCYLRTKDLSESALGLNFLAFRKLNLYSCRKICRTSLELTVIPDVSCASERIISEL